jgi:hypothetical protein
MKANALIYDARRSDDRHAKSGPSPDASATISMGVPITGSKVVDSSKRQAIRSPMSRSTMQTGCTGIAPKAIAVHPASLRSLNGVRNGDLSRCSSARARGDPVLLSHRKHLFRSSLTGDND